MQIPYLRQNVDGVRSMTLFLGGVPTPIDETHPSFDYIDENIMTITAQEVRELMDTSKRVRKLLAQFGNVSVESDTVFYKGEAVHGHLAERMLDMLENNLDIRPWALFLENLMQNPAKHAIDELYGWLEHANMPITERGNFLAYKKVTEFYTSYHNNPDGTPFQNDIGTFVSMDRNKVDDNRNRTCSSGLHFCSWDYLGSYMGNRGKVVILEINPAHVVSIPTDYNNAKGRAEGYLIVGEIPQEECRHAFPGLSYASYESSKYITHRQEGDIDYSSIDEGWFSGNYISDEDDTLEEAAYTLGQEQGREDALNDDFFELRLTDWDFDTPEEYEAYENGYEDSFYQAQYEKVKEEKEAMEELEELLDNMFEDEYVVEDLVDMEVDTVVDMGPTPRVSQVNEWTVDTVINDINNGTLTMSEFIKFFEPTQYELLTVVEYVD